MWRRQYSRHGLLTLFLLSAVVVRGGLAQSPGFLLVSAPRSATVSWVRLPESGSFEGLLPKTLIDSGLRNPQGLAVDQKRKRLYVADPAAERVYCYFLRFDGSQLQTDVSQRATVLRDAETRWVSVDGVGNLFFSDEQRNMILKIPAEQVLTNAVPEVVYDGARSLAVNEPAGLAVDNFHVYWTNKHAGTKVGSLLRGSESPELGAVGEAPSSVMASNVVKAYGVCMALGNVYYTGERRYVYGIKKTGGPVSEVSHSLTTPRGCAWDGDGTIYVADRGQNAIFAFAGNMKHITPAVLTKAFVVDDAFGLAVAMDTSCATRALALASLALGAAAYFF